MRIAIFTDSYTPYVSGVVRSIQRFNIGLTRLGHEVFVFAPSYRRANPEDSHDETGAKVFRFFSLRAPNYRDFSLPIPISPRAERLMHELEIDVIHSHTPFLMGQMSTNLAWRAGLPLVFTHHTMYHEYVHYIPAPRTMTRQMVIRFLQHYCRLCDHIIAPTPKVQTMIEELYGLNVPVSTVPTGVDLAPYAQADPHFLSQCLNLPEDTSFLLFVGRLGKEKNPQIVLDAFSLLAPSFPDLHLAFVGGGPEKEALENLAAEKDLRQRVHFTGTLQAQDVVSAYASAKVFVFGSTTETQGLVTIEAMAAGTPVVAVCATGSEDLIEHGRSGYLTENSADSLAEYTRRLLENSEIYQVMQREARRRAEEYSLTSTSQQLVKIYSHVSQQPRDPKRFPRLLSWS